MTTATNLHPVFQQAMAPFMHTRRQPARRPTLTPRERELLSALQLMKGWCIHYAEPFASGTPMYPSLQRDLQIASKAIELATGGNES